MNLVRSLLVPFLLMSLPVAAQEIGTLTLVEGPLRIIRGANVLKGAEGVRLQQGDIIESSDAGFAQLEFTGGAIVALGASTRVFLLSSHAPSRNAGSVPTSAELVLLSGWLKGQSGSKAGACRYDSPLLAATTQDGTLVLHSTPAAGEVFVESGSARIGEVSPVGIMRDPQVAKAGQFYARPAGKNLTVSPRPSPPYLEAMPRPFRDTFSPLAPRFVGKPPQPKSDHQVSYSEIQPWLTTAQAWRKSFVKRFQSRLNDPAFRNALEAHLKDHPEWDPVIHPEHNQPKTSSTPVESKNRQ